MALENPVFGNLLAREDSHQHNARWHARHQAEKRYGVHLDDCDYFGACMQIQAGLSRWLADSYGASIHLVKVGDQQLRAVWNPGMDRIATFLPMQGVNA